ncbi:MAG: response regulator [Anaerolineales bacterium]|nr:response regulator [Anaerolineales bacterium]
MNNKETILIVEDNQILREGLRDILSYEGFTILTAVHGQDALDQMGTITPDLILSDISMPEMDGIAFFKSVRKHADWVTIPFVFLTARGEKEDVLTGKNLGAEDYLIKPLSREELLTAVRGRLNRSRQIRVAQLQQAYEASLTVLANAIDVRDAYTRGHVERVTAYSQTLAFEMGWQGRQVEQLRFGAILHDIGKIVIQESTLLKPGALDNDEWEIMKRHPITGAEMIKDIPYLAPAIPVIRHHHERWDGKGYPDQLAGYAIPLSARIVAIADGFDAMTIDRPYRVRLSLEDAAKEIESCSGTQYDPACVAAFMKAWDDNKIQQIWENWQAVHLMPLKV